MGRSEWWKDSRKKRLIRYDAEMATDTLLKKDFQMSTCSTVAHNQTSRKSKSSDLHDVRLCASLFRSDFEMTFFYSAGSCATLVFFTETIARDFLFSVLYVNQLYLGPWLLIWSIFISYSRRYCRKYDSTVRQTATIQLLFQITRVKKLFYFY